MSENKQDKPRICEVLGVEVGEHFKVGTAEQEYYFDEFGEMRCCVWDGAWDLKCNNVLCGAINHPERIIRKPRFTEDEIAFMRYLYGCGVRNIERSSGAIDDMVVFTGIDKFDSRRFWALPQRCLPSLRPGESVELREVVGGDE